MQKVHSYYLFKFSLELLLNLLFQCISLTVLILYRLYIFFSLRGRVPYVLTDFFPLYYLKYIYKMYYHFIYIFKRLLLFRRHQITISFDFFS